MAAFDGQAGHRRVFVRRIQHDAAESDLSEARREREIRIEIEIKSQASEALAAMGLSVSDAVRILLKRVVNDQAFPLELKVPNAQTRLAMEEARALTKVRAARFDSADELIDDLENVSFGGSQKVRQQ